MTETVKVELFDLDQAAEADLRAFYEAAIAAQQVDRPGEAVYAYPEWLEAVRKPPAGYGVRMLWVARSAGDLVAYAHAYFPEGENENLALTTITVPPERRRNGVGTAVLRELLPLLESYGKTAVEGWNVTKGGAGDLWAAAVGFRIAKSTVTQLLVFADVDPSLWETAVPDGYRLESWVGAAPEQLVASLARARSAMHDAPVGESDYKFADWTVDRLREAEAELQKREIEVRVVVAVHEATGEVAGLTMLELHPPTPTTAWQQETSVVPAHRGNGIGRCIKAHMVRWLRADRPEFEQIYTSTSADNEHMIRVNHQIGFKTVRTAIAVHAEIAELSAVRA